MDTWRRSTGQHSQQKWQMVASIPRACCICDGRICCGAARPTACLCTGKVTDSGAVRKAPAHMSRRRTRMCEAQRLPPRRHMLRSQHVGARFATSTCKFARVVKGVDLRSTAGNCAWVRAPQLAIEHVSAISRLQLGLTSALMHWHKHASFGAAVLQALASATQGQATGASEVSAQQPWPAEPVRAAGSMLATTRDITNASWPRPPMCETKPARIARCSRSPSQHVLGAMA